MLLAVLALATGCSTARFYSQAALGQLEIVRKQRPIPQATNDPAITSATRDRIRVVDELCRFASTNLDLPGAGQYRGYADLGRPHVVWNVFAAPEFSVEARRWWYPLVGSLKYRGYFKECLAETYAATLRAKGEDVFVGGVSAYSTLGWFHDPILNTWVHQADADLADLVFHELSHRRVFITGDTDFNEAFAMATARIGVRRWLGTAKRLDALAMYESELARDARFAEAVQQSREALKTLYAEARLTDSHGRLVRGLDPGRIEACRRQKTAILGELTRRFPDRLPKGANNARLNEVDAYYRLIPAFEQLYDRCGGDLPRYYAEVRRIGRMNKVARAKAMGTERDAISIRSADARPVRTTPR